jgi:hypothetical protein
MDGRHHSNQQRQTMGMLRIVTKSEALKQKMAEEDRIRKSRLPSEAYRQSVHFPATKCFVIGRTVRWEGSVSLAMEALKILERLGRLVEYMDDQYSAVIQVEMPEGTHQWELITQCPGVAYNKCLNGSWV